MGSANIEEIIIHLEAHLDCWQRFAEFVGKARTKQFDEEDETEFLELKSSLMQQLEEILNFSEDGTPARADVHDLVNDAPSIRYVSELTNDTRRNLEMKWHRLFVAWQAVMGELKASGKTLEVAELISHLENHLELWKQFRNFIAMGISKNFTEDDELQFTEVKGGMVEGLALIMAAIEDGAPPREDIVDMIEYAPSIQFMSELGEVTLRGMEANWHKLYLAWQSVVGELKVAEGDLEVDEVIGQLEDYLQNFKRFNQYILDSKTGKYAEEDEESFLAIKSDLARELEIILGSIEDGGPPREEIHELISGAGSLRYLNGLTDSSHKSLENNWHKIFLQCQAVLGQLKVIQKQQPAKKKGFFARLFGG
jgi:hypothetical protein